ncbi:DMT family transporter [Escherichia coli]|uniref:DMT family transporter n=1 Tax=Escherichia coli TaxID=562 RepID=UPI002543BB08|nr:DMT family transporter [Escherichia coli]
MQNILMNLAFYLLVVAAGASFSLQQAANNHLRAELLSPWWAGFISYVGGSLAMLVMALVCRGLACHGICFRVPARFHGQAVF